MDLDGDSDQQKDNRPAASEATSAEAQGGASGDEKNEARVEGDRQAEEEVHLSHEGHVEDEESAEGEDLLNSPPFLKRKIEILEKELQSLREELQAARHAADSERDSVLRLAAEFDNFRRRVAREKQQEELRGRMRAVQMLLPAIDNFDRAAQSLKPQHEEALKIQQSYQVLCKQVLDAFSKMGVETVDPLGTQFDPKLHEAIQRVESTEHPDGVVTQVFQKGYFLRDASTAQSSGDGSSEGILIRAAVCAVSIGPGPSSPESSSSAKSAASSAEGQSHDEDAASSLNDESSE
jgi:molecular chaperone GrpE